MVQLKKDRDDKFDHPCSVSTDLDNPPRYLGIMKTGRTATGVLMITVMTSEVNKRIVSRVSYYISGNSKRKRTVR